MRTLLLVCLLAVAVTGFLPANVGATGGAESRAQELDKALQAVEWYTNEMVRKALQAEVDHDFVNAEKFGDKAIESDLKAKSLRAETVAAWQAADRPARARDAWHRAADMAAERAAMLAKRLPALQAGWQAEGLSADLQRESQALYVQGLYLTTQQWALAGEFLDSAADEKGAQNARHEMAELLTQLSDPRHAALLQQDARLVGSAAQLAAWQALPVAP